MGNTTLTVEESTLERFKSLKRELDSRQDSVPDHTSNSFLAALLDTWEATDETKATPEEDVTVEQIREQLDTDAPNYDDVKQACRAAIREDLPERKLQ